MALFNLKTILNKKSPVYSLLEELCGMMNVHVQVSDTAGNIFFNNNPGTGASQFPVGIDGELIGYVTGDAKARLIAGLLTALLQKENDKKKLGKEVLNLYKEINFIFDFSEKLAQAIDPSAIARIALEEAGQLIHSDGGVVVLWNEDTKQLKPVTSSGQVFFNLEKVNEGISLLLKIVLSGQSEITSDIADLKQTGIIKAEVNSIIYGALKVNQRVMGAIILADYTLQQYSAADLKLLTTLALQSSSAIESAMLYEKNIREAREKEEAMRRLFEV
ncbi:MAG: GAF domain-containing protein, partial [Bacteroidetes bacterium]|nr:GAF domain-containing protein [Bacteroidota bacterium]